MTPIDGWCRDDFKGVAVAFQKNFDRGDLGATVCVIHGGQTVVDLWGGYRDTNSRVPWLRDTIVNVWSTTKTIAALCVLVLHDRDDLSVDEPIARWWPEFAAAGKDGVLVRHVLSHTAGLPDFAEPLSDDELWDPSGMCDRLVAQSTLWPPGDGFGYHAFTQGVLLGELVRRVTGRTMGTWLREEITGPMGIDFHIGVPDSAIHRIAEMSTADMSDNASANPRRIEQVNTRRWQQAEFAASNGHGNARSIAQLLSHFTRFPVLGNPLLSRATIARTAEVQYCGHDYVTGRDLRMGVGFGLNSPGMPLGMNDRTILWGGLGGSMALVDLNNDLVIVYAMNKMLDGVSGGVRSARLIFAAHAATR